MPKPTLPVELQIFILIAVLTAFVYFMGYLDNPARTFAPSNIDLNLAATEDINISADENFQNDVNDAAGSSLDLNVLHENIDENSDFAVQATLDEDLGPCLAEQVVARATACIIEVGKRRKDIAACEKIDPISNGRCIEEVAIEAQDERACMKLSSSAARDRCIHTVAVSKGDYSLCTKIGLQSARDLCLKETAIKTQSPSVCSSIGVPDIRDDCYVKTVQLTSDSSFCAKVGSRKDANGYMRDECYRVASGGNIAGEECFLLLSRENQSMCFENATNKTTSDLNCFGLQTPGISEKCQQWYALASGNAKECYKLPATLREECFAGILSNNANMENCGAMPFSKTRDDCYKAVASESKQADACSKISDPLSGDSCFIEIAVQQYDPSICTKVRKNNIAGNDVCYSLVALSLDDYKVCESIIADARYYECYADIALKFSAPEICSYSARPKTSSLSYPSEQYCLETYAVKKIDRQMCSSLVPGLKKDCLEKIETALACINNDGICNSGKCSYFNDNDCPSPFYCGTDAECNDYKKGTTDLCQSNRCVNILIAECIDNDNYCPNGCTYVGNPNANLNEDSDCMPTCEQAGGTLCQIGKRCENDYIIPGTLEAGCCISSTFCK